MRVRQGDAEEDMARESRKCSCNQRALGSYNKSVLRIGVFTYAFAGVVLAVSFNLVVAAAYIGVLISIWAIGALAALTIWRHSLSCSVRMSGLMMLNVTQFFSVGAVLYGQKK